MAQWAMGNRGLGFFLFLCVICLLCKGEAQTQTRLLLGPGPVRCTQGTAAGGWGRNLHGTETGTHGYEDLHFHVHTTSSEDVRAWTFIQRLQSRRYHYRNIQLTTFNSHI